MAPYYLNGVPNEGAMGDDITGSCVCGDVRWAIRAPFRFFQYCHCSRCRKRSGTAHAANISVVKEQFRWLAGEEHARRFELPTAQYWCSGFCVRCGSAVPWLNRSGVAYLVPAGGLDVDPGLRPTRNVHFASRAPWYTHATDLPFLDET